MVYQCFVLNEDGTATPVETIYQYQENIYLLFKIKDRIFKKIDRMAYIMRRRTFQM